MRFVDEGTIKEHYLFCKEVPVRTTGEEIFRVTDDLFKTCVSGCWFVCWYRSKLFFSAFLRQLRTEYVGVLRVGYLRGDAEIEGSSYVGSTEVLRNHPTTGTLIF